MNQASRTTAPAQPGADLELTVNQVNQLVRIFKNMSASATEALAILTESATTADDGNAAGLSIAQAAAYARQPAEAIEAALQTGDLRGLAPGALDAWRRGLTAKAIIG